MDNGTSRKKMAYQTKKQKEYLLAYEKTNLIASLHEDEKAALKKRQLPEASWTLPELLASGRKFTYEFNGKSICRWPDHKERGGATDFVSLSQLTSFYMALIADADMQYTKVLGELLSAPLSVAGGVLPARHAF